MAYKEILKKLQQKPDYESIIAAKAKFKDKEFPTTEASLGADYKTFKFKSAVEIFGPEMKIYDSFSPNDIQQGANGDCYFLSGIAALAEFPNRLEKLFKTKEVNEAGCYAVTFFICGYPTTVMVDDYFAVNSKGEPAFSGTKSKELWVMILEKAWAKIHGNYTNADGGDPRESMGALTGSPCDRFDHASYATRKDDLWKLIKEFDRLKYVMCTGGIKKEVKGLEKGHVYTLINAYEVESEGKPVRLLQLRNPWGMGEWPGDWADGDTKHWTPELDKQLNHKNEDDGTFFMCFEDFLNYYTYTMVSRVRDDFINSHIYFEKTNAFATFIVPNKLKGCITSYQFTKRIAATIGKDVSHESLSMELYVLRGGKLESVSKKAESKQIWYANIPLYLEAGTYVVHAYFPQPSKSCPYISLMVFADIGVEILPIQAETMQELSPGKIMAVLKKSKNGYSIVKPPIKLMCGLDKCENCHKLNWRTEDQNEKYRCEMCRKEKNADDGRWNCKECNFDICIECRPKYLFTESDSEDKKVRCLFGHDVKIEKDSDMPRVYVCTMCGRAHFSNEPHWACKQCGYDICFACLTPPENFGNVADPEEITLCPRNHELIFSDQMTPDGSYNCAFCGRIGEPLKGRWYCIECNLNICPCCVLPKDKKKIPVTTPSFITACLKGHVLQYSSYETPSITHQECDKCNAQIPIGSWRWNCPECAHDICNKCRAAPEGRTDILCNRKHMLCFSTALDNGSLTTRCDKCGKSFNVTNGRFGCPICSYDVCPTCEPFSLADANEAGAVIEHRGKPVAERNSTRREPNPQDFPQRQRENCGPCIII